MNYLPWGRILAGFGVLFICSQSQLFAQNTQTRWFFGNSEFSLTFDPNGRDVSLDSVKSLDYEGMSGGITINDQFTGNLFFYTDGSVVYDASHQPTADGTILNVNTTVNVPVVTCPVPGNPGQFYIFTNTGTEINFAVVDTSAVGNGSELFPLGEVISANQTLPFSDNPAEGMLVIPVGDGESFWLFSQDRTTYDIRFILIDENGPGFTNIENFVEGFRPGFEAAHFAYNPDSSLLAMVPKTPNRNIWIMSFDREGNGDLDFEQVLLNTGVSDSPNQAIYDVEWSNDGTKLYYSRFGGNVNENVGQIYHVDFFDSLQTISPVLENPVYRSLGLKRAIDNRIYHLYEENQGNPILLGRLNNPDSLVDSVDYQPQVFDVDFEGTQFPEFTDAYDFQFDVIRFTYIDSCVNNITKFFPEVIPSPTSITWDFGDGTTSDALLPLHEYATDSVYTVRMFAEINGITQEARNLVEVLPNNLMADLGNDTTICVGDSLWIKPGTNFPPGTQFVWSTGPDDAGRDSINVKEGGTYWVEVSNEGCSAFDEIVVTEYGVQESISNQWYFGEEAGIEFTEGPIAILDGNRQNAPEGCATVSDVNGDLLFYTNGFTVWNRLHEVMQNGDSIGGDLFSDQNSLIMPFNGDNTMFYIFTTDQFNQEKTNALRYTIIDMKKANGLGAVVSTIDFSLKDLSLMGNGTERITGSGFTGSDLIMTHELGNNQFRAFNTSASGLIGPIISPVGQVHSFFNLDDAEGYMKIAPNNELVAINIPGQESIEIFDLEDGVLSNSRLINTNETDLYGLEFSTMSTKLYVSTDSKVIQYDLDSINSENPARDIANSKFEIDNSGSGYGALQTGPNGIIYLAVDGEGSVGTINSPDGDDDGAGFSPSGFSLEGRTSRLGLPNFAQNESTPSMVPTITVTAGCLGQESEFVGSGRDSSIENYLWLFGDGQSSTDQNTTHIYQDTGTYNVQLRLSNRCDEDTVLTQTIVINSLPESPTVETEVALCDDFVELDAGEGPYFYFWSTGDTTRTIRLTEPAFLQVAIIDSVTLCPSDTVDVFVADARPQIDLVPSLQFCQNDPPFTLDSELNFGTYEWRVDGVLQDTTRTFDVDTSQPGVFEYTIEATNSFGCIGRDTVAVTIQAGPELLIIVNPTTGCGADDGSLEITFTESGSFQYELSGTDNRGPFTVDGPATITIPDPISPGDLEPGNYTVTATNLVTGCEIERQIQIEDPGSFNFTVTPSGECEGEVTLRLEAVPTSFTYEVIDGDGVTRFSGVDSQTIFSGLDPDTYTVLVTDNGGQGCTEVETVTVTPGDEPQFSFNAIQEFCGQEGTVSINDGNQPSDNVTYTWTGPIVGPTEGEQVVVNGTGEFEVIVTASAPGLCTVVDTILVRQNNEPQLSIDRSGDPCDGAVVLTANVTGGSDNYVFEWSDGRQSPVITVTASDSLGLTVTDQTTGCVVTDGANVEIENEFNVVTTLDPDCDNNGLATLQATTNYFDPGITYQWFFITDQNERDTLFNETDSLLVVAETGRYEVVATNETGVCTASDVFDVVIVPINPEDILLDETETFCRANPDNPGVELDPGTFNAYEWRVAGDTTIITTDPTLFVDEAGSYEVTLFNGFTCTRVVVNVREDCRPTIFAPNAFSPNGNGINDEFFIYPSDFIDLFEIIIYNRWGEPVFRSEDINFRWDGTYRGGLAPPGTYAYIMKFSSTIDEAGGTIEQYGSVTLIR
jgi:gliding motility-associated-like protein